MNKGLSFTTTLGLIFIVLKLCEVINWSWWLVLLPFYYLIILIFGVGFISAFWHDLSLWYLKLITKQRK